MKNYRNILTLFLCAALVAAGLFFYLKKESREQPLPTLSPRAFEEKPSAEYLSTLRAVEKYRARIQKKPQLTENYMELAQLFLQESRVTGNHHEYIPRAQEVIERALRIDPQDFGANATLANIYMIQHQFVKAREVIRQTIQRYPQSAYAYGVLCDAQVELGEYQQAVEACDHMLSLRPDLRSYARASYLREIHGQYAGATEAMKRAADAGAFGYENRAWALYNLANLYLQHGAADTAEFIYKGILEERPNYAYALSGLAEVACNRREYARAIELLVKAVQVNPEHIFLEKLAEVYRLMGQKEAENQMIGKVLEAYRQHEEYGWNVNLELARFSAHHGVHLDEALQRIEQEMQVRPENIDVLDTYAWVLYRSGRATEAVTFIEKAMRLKTLRPSLYYHAGAIYGAAGDQQKADQYLRMALQRGSAAALAFNSEAQALLQALRPARSSQSL